MPQPILYLAITNHGFGHATRLTAIAAEIKRQCPDALLFFVTTAPRWLLEAYLPYDFVQRQRALDIGVVQTDSLNMDKPATLAKLRELQAKQDRLIAAEVDFIRQNRVGLVLADIPPLAAPIAKTAGVPCWMASNFGWDFIYRDWGGEFGAIADWMGTCFQQCDRLFRLPLHESMSAFPHITDVGFTGGTPRYTVAQLRADLPWDTPRDRTVLLTFGGLGLNAIPYANLTQFPDWRFLTFDRQAPDLPNLVKINHKAYRPVDLMPLCGRVISKPGYSTFAEAIRTQTPLISLERAGFAEAPVLLNGLQQYIPHQIVSYQTFFEGDWSFLTQSLTPPLSPPAPLVDGNQTIAQAVLDYFQAAA